LPEPCRIALRAEVAVGSREAVPGTAALGQAALHLNLGLIAVRLSGVAHRGRSAVAEGGGKQDAKRLVALARE
jgi:hypothetical protein